MVANSILELATSFILCTLYSRSLPVPSPHAIQGGIRRPAAQEGKRVFLMRLGHDLFATMNLLVADGGCTRSP